MNLHPKSIPPKSMSLYKCLNSAGSSLVSLVTETQKAHVKKKKKKKAYNMGGVAA